MAILAIGVTACSATAPSGPDRPLVATIRSEPQSFNRLLATDRVSHVLSLLLHGRLVRINLATQEVEPWLAERWHAADDGLEWTLELRRDVRFSDGTPFTAADVVFSFAAVYAESVSSPLGDAMRIAGEPIAVTEVDPHTVRLRYPSPFGPGLRVLDNLPILPSHRLSGALDAGAFADEWGLATEPADLVGLGPFVIASYQPGQRLELAPNPHYWRRDATGTPLPYLDTLILEIVPDQNAEILRLQNGESDMMSGALRPEDIPAFRRLDDEGAVHLHDLGVGLDTNPMWFNLTAEFAARHPDRAWLQQPELRQAISVGIDRQEFAELVYLGAGVPIAGPVTPANRTWFVPDLTPPAHDPAEAARLLDEAGLADTDGDGVRESAPGVPARFTLLTQQGNSLRERAAAHLQERLRALGLLVDVVALDPPTLVSRIVGADYEAVLFGTHATDTDPAVSLDFWLSSGAFHFWRPGQPEPATSWEERIDELMVAQMSATDRATRQALFAEVQRVFAAESPALYFAAQHLYVATSARVSGVVPAVLTPHVLWNADMLTLATVDPASP